MTFHATEMYDENGWPWIAVRGLGPLPVLLDRTEACVLREKLEEAIRRTGPLPSSVWRESE